MLIYNVYFVSAISNHKDREKKRKKGGGGGRSSVRLSADDRAAPPSGQGVAGECAFLINL